MSKGIYPDHWNDTCAGNTQSKGDGCTWLGHHEEAQAGKIDMLILAGCYTADDIADRLADLFPENSRDHKQWVDRVGDHVAHLECENNGGGTPHNLVVKEDANGVLSFDCSARPPRCPPLHGDKRGRRKFNHLRP